MSIVDEQFMQYAIDLAMAGRGSVEPNPMVGCIIVKSGRLIGRGIHRAYGQAHAEPNALRDCSESPDGGTAYITLEPCNHTNKQTPPCVPRLIQANLARVVVGGVDPNPKVSGRGIAQLRAAGIEVITGVLEKQCRQLAVLFMHRMQQSSTPARPYVTLKWAQSANGKIAGANGTRVRISNAHSRAAVHRLRSAIDSIMVGIDTVLKDDPLLTPRGIASRRKPARYVIDRQLQISPDARLLTDRSSSTTILTSMPGLNLNSVLIEELHGHLSLLKILELVCKQGHFDLLVESGRKLASAMLKENLVDRLWIIQSAQVIGEDNAPVSCAIPPHFITTGKIDLTGDVLTEFLNPDSTNYHIAQPSADFTALLEQPV